MKNFIFVILFTLLCFGLTRPTVPTGQIPTPLKVGPTTTTLPKVKVPKTFTKPIKKPTKDIQCFRQFLRTKFTCSARVKNVNRLANGILTQFSQLGAAKYVKKLKILKNIGKRVDKVLAFIEKTTKCIKKRNTLKNTCQNRCRRRQVSLRKRLLFNKDRLKYFRRTRCGDIKHRINLKREDPTLKTDLKKLLAEYKQCTKGMTRKRCPNLYKSCGPYSVPDQFRTKVITNNYYIKLFEKRLKTLSNKDKAIKQILIKRIRTLKNRNHGFVRNTKTSLCLRKTRALIERSKDFIKRKTEEYKKTKNTSIPALIDAEAKQLAKLRTKIFQCKIKRSGLSFSNCQFWSKAVLKLKDAIPKLKSLVSKMPTLQKKVENFTKRLNGYTRKVKQCQSWVQTQKICKTCKMSCNLVNKDCHKKCHQSQDPTTCVTLCRKSQAKCIYTCEHKPNCKVNYARKRCDRKCHVSQKCSKSCENDLNYKLCFYRCQDKCKGECVKKMKASTEKREIYKICKRLEAKEKYLAILITKTKASKNQSQAVKDAQARFSTIMAKVTLKKTSLKCQDFKKVPQYCAKIRIFGKCSQKYIEQGKAIKEEINRKRKLTVLKKKVEATCKNGLKMLVTPPKKIPLPKTPVVKKPKVVTKPVVKKPKVVTKPVTKPVVVTKPVTGKPGVSKGYPPVVKTPTGVVKTPSGVTVDCSTLQKDIANLRQKFNERTNLLIQFQKTKDPKVGAEAEKTRVPLVTLLRQVRSKQKACQKK